MYSEIAFYRAIDVHGSHVVEVLVRMLDKNSTERSSEFGLERERGLLN